MEKRTLLLIQNGMRKRSGRGEWMNRERTKDVFVIEMS